MKCGAKKKLFNKAWVAVACFRMFRWMQTKLHRIKIRIQEGFGMAWLVEDEE